MDSDDSKPNERKALLEKALKRNGLEGAVGVAVKEFETWLIADTKAVSTVLGGSNNTSSNPESLPCRKAKQLLAGWSKEIETPHRSPVDIRKELASTMDLESVSNLCPSFKAFRQALLQMQAQDISL